MKRSTLLIALMMVVAILAPATAASGADLASDGGTSTEHDLSSAQQWKAEMIAGYFEEVPEDEALDLVIGLRTAEPAMGWGVLSKLVAYAIASDMEFQEFLTSAQNEDGGYSMGELRKEYLKEFELDDLPYKNFGQMQKAEKPPKPDKANKKTPPGQAKKS